ncbi:DUF2075 domain-containing protein [Sphingobacterium sp. UT-1RO-CII-1]|uniref:DNA/RNA helicase domain-containing protein n=1 Tax=Sphingobacterium sp. UT-1RO-CII-1 TaxID=2995225 RepID=UPI00227CD4C6|nr:DNA/RNA helicase domain-containing protein [Sphingobacterium sp. UT-1RO-CII-1]MCY4779088.1 DUF2075 domain-containing protein [Sphingobacterium sp. UT-1RO-CII-1]
MSQIDIKEVHIIPVGSVGEVKDSDSELDFYNSALVYLLNDTKSIYIGESIDIKNRFSNHNRHIQKKDLLVRHAIYSHLFNKSVTLHLEAFLINLFSAEKGLTLINANLGNNGHYYHQKKEYEELFPKIWKELKELKIARTSFEKIINSNVFKYSPYKSLNLDQQQAVLSCLNMLVSEKKGMFIQGNAGTGKTIIAIYILKLLVTPIRYFEQFEMEDEFSIEAFRLLNLYREAHGITEANESELKNDIALVVSMASLRSTLQKVFRDIDQLSSSMVISPTDISKRSYKIVLVDEAHRLKQRKNISGYAEFDNSNERLGFDIHQGTELDWILKQSDHQILFYDSNQSIKKTDLPSARFEALLHNVQYDTIHLKTQIRSKGGDLFTDFVHRLFDMELLPQESFHSNNFELKLYESFVSMRAQVFQKEKSEGLSRLVAGFSWKYKTKDKKNRHLYDMTIEGVDLRWNSSAKDWINSENAIEEVGSIHTVFGNDLNYIAIVFGYEIDYDPETDSIVVDRDQYQDINGKNSTDDKDLLFYIKNIYKTLMFRGIKGVYLYAMNQNLKTYLSRHMEIVSATALSQSEQALELQKNSIFIKSTASESTISYYDLAIAAGGFSELQQSDSTQYIEVDERYQDSERYFACRVVGESMNKIIPNGSVCLFERYEAGSRNGLICLVESDSFEDRDFGANYTVKEYTSKKTITDEGWQHQEIILLPKSTDPTYRPIILRDEETTDLKVIGVFKMVL